MKKITVIILFSLITFSCSEIDQDCMCTEEYRSYLVTVVDTLGIPVDSLDVTVRDENGAELSVVQDQYPWGVGNYTVMSDSFTKIFCSCTLPEKIYFSATDGNRIANGEFLFNTDECYCHVYKVSGPDTLVLK
jgi:hypothetical protein